MLSRSKLPLLIFSVVCLELAINLWAVGMTRHEFVFDKCARNSGRVSAIINLGLLLMIGYHGFGRILGDEVKKDAFRVLITLFTVNHVIHLSFVLLNFDHHELTLSWVEHMHGVLTFACLLAVPVVLWSVKRPRPWWNVLLLIHLFNVSYFIMKTFYSKIKPDHPAYHNQMGIVITSAALVYVLFRTVRAYAPIRNVA